MLGEPLQCAGDAALANHVVNAPPGRGFCKQLERAAQKV
jgi:hypothetical protein